MRHALSVRAGGDDATAGLDSDIGGQQEAGRQEGRARDESVLLMAQIAAGDTAALGRLYDLFSSLAYGLAQRMLGDAALAQDAVQEAFLAVWRHAQQFDPQRGTLRAWLLTVVHHRCITVLRGRRSSALEDPLDEESAVTGSDEVWERVARGLDALDIQRAMTGLPEEQREVVRLAYFVGLTHPQIAAQLDVPLGTVKGRMRLALRKLRDALVGTEDGRTAPEGR